MATPAAKTMPGPSQPYDPTTVVDLALVRRRQIQRSDDLSPLEREQLRAVFRPRSIESMLTELRGTLEVADVVERSGAVVYRLYAWDPGVGYLFTAIGLQVVGFGSRHDIEHWNRDQRDLFVAMDRALRARGHGFRQPLQFCWHDDACWEALDGTTPGTVGSEPMIRERLIKEMN